MAAAIKYFDTAKIAYARVTTGVTSTDGTGSLTSLTWYNSAPTTDWMLVKCIVSSSSATGVGDLADSLIHFFVTDGTTVRRIRTVDPGNPAAGSTTVSEFQIEVNFGPEFLFAAAATTTLQVGVSVTPTAGNVDFVFFCQAA